MKTIKIWFSDFYEGFEPENNYLYHLLSSHYSVELSPERPDFLFFSCYGHSFLKYNCVRIYYTGENLRPDFNLCDYAIGFDYLEFGKRYLRYPNFAFLEDQFLQLLKPEEQKGVSPSNKDHFCNFIYSNSDADPIRDRFFHLLNRYKKVDSPGNHLNNVSINVGKRFSRDWRYSKIEFQSRCKFSIAFENSSSPGYTTEKLMHSFISNTIPIYWGNPEVEKDFNPKAFINCHNFQSFDEVVERVKKLDKDPELYNAVLNEPPFRENIIPENLHKETLLDFLKSILDENPGEALKRPAYGTTVKYEKNLKDVINLKNRISGIKKMFSLK